MADIFNNLVEWLDSFAMRLTDPVLGWLLGLPRDVVITGLAALTALVMVLVRKRFTDQKWLGRADADQKRLDELIKEAKARRDKAAKARHQLTKSTIQMRAMKFEGKPLLIVIVPVMLMLTWCFNRMEFMPPAAGEGAHVKLMVEKSAIGSLVHIAPQPGLEARSGGWVQRVVRDTPEEPTKPWDRGNAWLVKQAAWLWSKVTRMPPADPADALEGVARWELAGPAQAAPYQLDVVFDGQPYRSELLVGQPHYATPERLIDSGKVQSIKLDMPRYYPYGFIGGLDWLFCPPWLIAYMLVAIPLFFIFKSLLKVY